MASTVKWIVIKDTSKPIGAIGFIDRKAAIVCAFYSDYDGNEDGKVSWGEKIVGKLSPIRLDGRQVTMVAMAARYNMDVLELDASFGQEAMQLFLNYARQAVTDGIYAAYFSRGIRAVGTGLAQTIGGGAVKQYLIRKGFETTVKQIYRIGVD